MLVLMLSTMFIAQVSSEPVAKLDLKEMVKKADLLLRGEQSAIEHMYFIVRRPGSTIERKTILYLKGKPFSFFQCLEPVRDLNITLLKRDGDVWMYTPSVRKSIRIPLANMHEGVLGSDFTYDDIINMSTLSDDYEPVLVGDSKAMEKEHGKVYVLDLTPLPGRPIAYKKLRLWIREKDNILLRQQYYDEKLQVTRALVYSDIKEMGGRNIPTKRTMVDLSKEGYSTELIFINAAFNTLTDDEIFSPRSLTEPPKPKF